EKHPASESEQNPGTRDGTNGTELLEAALNYAALGWKVLPVHHITAAGICSCRKGAACESAGKHPHTTNWSGSAPDKPKGPSSDPAQIKRCWRTWPHANVGILTGPESGIFDLDVEEEGLADLAALEQANSTLPETPRARSGNGGLHIVFL